MRFELVALASAILFKRPSHIPSGRSFSCCNPDGKDVDVSRRISIFLKVSQSIKIVFFDAFGCRLVAGITVGSCLPFLYLDSYTSRKGII
jgi:hypothetical protein